MSTHRTSRVPRKRRLAEAGPSGGSNVASLTSMTSNEPGMLLVISGPSGVGKDTVWQEASGCLSSFAKTITCTTRRQRPGEEEGVTYFFMSNEDFDELIEQDELLEWAEVHGNRYGIPAALVLQRLEQGLDVVCVIDVQGARRIRKLFMTRALLIFIEPPPDRDAEEVLRERMAARGDSMDETAERRIETAKDELNQTDIFDYRVINDNVPRVAAEICDIIAREKSLRAKNH